MRWGYYEIILAILISMSHKLVNATSSCEIRSTIYTSTGGTGSSMYHEIKVLFADVNQDSLTGFYVSKKRLADCSYNYKYFENNYRNRRYLYFLVNDDKTHEFKRPYVAYEIALGCDGTTPKLTYKIKYFTCTADAVTFYTSATSPKRMYNGIENDAKYSDGGTSPDIFTAPTLPTCA